MNLIQKMDKSDWIFLLGYVVLMLVIAIVVDLILHIGNGGFIVVFGCIMGGVLLRNRLQQKSKK